MHVGVGWFHTANLVDERCSFCQFCQTTGGSTQLGRFEHDLGYDARHIAGADVYRKAYHQ
jgi:hypothetical protein